MESQLKRNILSLAEVVEGDVINHTKEGQELSVLAQMLLVTYYSKHNTGFQDGGCLVYATFIKEAIEEQGHKCEIVVVGREDINDHYIAKANTKYGETYIDSDGIFTKEEMINKVDEFENIDNNKIVIRTIDLDNRDDEHEVVFDRELASEMYINSYTSFKGIDLREIINSLYDSVPFVDRDIKEIDASINAISNAAHIETYLSPYFHVENVDVFTGVVNDEGNEMHKPHIFHIGRGFTIKNTNTGHCYETTYHRVRRKWYCEVSLFRDKENWICPDSLGMLVRDNIDEVIAELSKELG